MEVIMKRKICLTLIFLVIVFAIFAIFKINKQDSNLKKVTVAEVAHSVFYAPQYVAHGLGYFKEEGLDVNIVLTYGKFVLFIIHN